MSDNPVATHVLHVEIQDSTCAEDEAIHMRVPLDTPKVDIMIAVEILYPTAHSVWVYSEPKEIE